MKPEILFIHCAGPQDQFEGSDFLVSYLRKTLGDSYTIRSPKMPDSENPQYDLWKDQVDSELNTMKEDPILIGHSLGGSILLKYLSELPVPKPVTGLFLIAAPYWGTAGWEVDEFVLKQRFAAHLHEVPNIFLYHSKDDEVVALPHIRYYAHQLPHATVHEINHRGHLYSRGLPELITDIKNLPHD